MSFRQTASLIKMTLLIIAALFCVGFFHFTQQVISYQDQPPDAGLSTDAVVVLTGGSERIITGIKVLQAGKAKKLFISGVYPGVNVTELLSGKDIPVELKECCIELGYRAGNTVGNADEVMEFMSRENYSSMRLVTANYHMPRSLLLMQEEMPSVSIIPHAVMPDTVDVRYWWKKPGTASLLVIEYCKYILAWVQTAIGVI